MGEGGSEVNGFWDDDDEWCSWGGGAWVGVSRRKRRQLAVADALFELVRGSVWDIAKKAGYPVGTVAAEINRMVADGLVGWSQLFLPTGGEPRYAAASTRVYQFNPKGREVIGARRLIQDDLVRYYVRPDEAPHPEQFEGLENVIMTGYVDAEGPSIQEIAAETRCRFWEGPL